MNRHHRTHTAHSRSLFAQPSSSSFSPTSEQSLNINPNSESINMTNTNYTPASSFIHLTGFDDMNTFITAPDNVKTSTVNSLHDNSFNDYNENGPNDINNSSYRQKLIKQMQQSLFNQSNSMFAQTEHINPNRQLTEHTYDADGPYRPSHAPSKYLQQQTKPIFKQMKVDEQKQ